MRRLVDVTCRKCKHTEIDVYLEDTEIAVCKKCHSLAEQVWWNTRSHDAEWSDKDAVVVFRKPDGTYSFPAINSKPTPPGWERIVAKSERQVADIERMTGTLNQDRWYDHGTGRGFDDDFRGKRYS